jgi:chemotaxis protein methyltransferase CheR
MSVIAPSRAELERFRILVQREFGLRFDDGGLHNLERILLRRLSVQRRHCDDYLKRLDAGSAQEIRELTVELTVGETYFLRHIEQFRALTRTALPELLRVPGRTAALRLLSAGCSTGEEAYSLAIMLRENGFGVDSVIIGVDVNPLSLERARSGRYTEWSLRTVPSATKQRWFVTDGDDVVLDPAVHAAVRFEQCNFAQDDPDLWRPESFDVIFCRNVIMYFTPAVMSQVVARFARSLVPGGYLFLGSAETLRGLSTEFELRESDGTFYYQRPDPNRPRPAPTARAQPVTPTRPLTRVQPVLMPKLVVDDNLDQVLDLLRLERFTEALTAMETLSGAVDADPEVLLIRAALLTHSGSLPAAERACRRLLEVDERSAGAHVLLAMCREEEQDLPAAVDHCRTAITFDPEFAMPHVHLGRLARRMGDPGTARRQYARSAQLLPAETGRRILLFGGGFNREALISLCRTQSADER